MSNEIMSEVLVAGDRLTLGRDLDTWYLDNGDVFDGSFICGDILEYIGGDTDACAVKSESDTGGLFFVFRKELCVSCGKLEREGEVMWPLDKGRSKDNHIFSGPKSITLWSELNAAGTSAQLRRAMYSMGCAMQEMEALVREHIAGEDKCGN